MPKLHVPSRLAHALVIIALAAGLIAPADAVAAPLDRIGGTAVGDSPALAAVAPDVDMPAGVLRTLDGRALWDRDADAERAMASTTKIMTALVVLDRAGMEDLVTVSSRAATVGESGVNIMAGQTMTVGELLEAMLVRSGNDAAHALAEHVGGDVATFVGMMNEKAASLGLAHTSFANPHGLDAAGHHTSAQDLATLTSVAMADPRFARIVALPSVTVMVGGRATKYESSNVLLKDYEGATGVKTGWTDDAGYCLVASASRGEVSFVAVVLGTDSETDRFDQAAQLLDWGFSHYAITPLAQAETTAALVPVTDYLDRTVTVVVEHDASAAVFDLDGDITLRTETTSEVDAPVVKGQRLGTLTVVQGDRLLAQVPIVAAADVPAPDGWDVVGIWITRLWRSVFGGQLQAAPSAVM